MKRGRIILILGVCILLLLTLMLLSISLYPHYMARRVEQLNPTWNVWAEEGSDNRYTPLTHLTPKTTDTEPEYSIWVHLSNYSYEEGGFFTLKAGDKIRKLIIDQLSLTPKTLALQIILIPDSEYFKPLANPVKDLVIDMDKIRTQLASGYKLEGNPLDVLRKQYPVLPPFVFGSTRFDGLETRGKEGTGYIGLAIWHEGKPIEDFSLAFCISSSGCEEKPPKLITQVSQSLPINLGSHPGAALHFFGLGEEKVVGVFWNNEKPADFPTWTIGMSKKGFYKQLKRIISNLNNSTTPEEWFNNGLALFNLLFPESKDGLDISAVFKEYITKHMATSPFENEDPPLLFVRFSENKADLPFIIPIGLAAVDMGNGKKDFIGFHYNIEEPLEKDITTVNPECINRWIVSLPAKDKAPDNKLKEAYDRIEKTVVTRWKSYSNNEFFDVIGQPAEEKEVKSFGAWIQENKEDKESALIIVMSHHGEGALSDSSGTALALNVNREFTQPSIAILNGCGTMEPGATDFIKKLNEGGVTTVIATSTSVESVMAGDFITCFDQQIEEARKGDKKEISMSDAFLRTLECLYKKPNEYDMKVLKYSLLGDGNVRLCIPEILPKEG